MGINQIKEVINTLDGTCDNKSDDKSTKDITNAHYDKLLAQEAKDREQARRYRKFFVWYVSIISALSFVSLIALSIFQGFNINSFNLDAPKFVALVSFGSIHVFGLLAVVIKYLFSPSKMPIQITEKHNK